MEASAGNLYAITNNLNALDLRFCVRVTDCKIKDHELKDYKEVVQNSYKCIYIFVSDIKYEKLNKQALTSFLEYV
jgi:hypothetical protein